MCPEQYAYTIYNDLMTVVINTLLTVKVISTKYSKTDFTFTIKDKELCLINLYNEKIRANDSLIHQHKQLRGTSRCPTLTLIL